MDPSKVKMVKNMFSGDVPDEKEAAKITKEEALETNEAYKCRYYRKKLPDREDIVMAKVDKVHADGSNSEVSLLEYEGKQGMLSHLELSNRRIRSLRSHISEDQIEPLAVKEVDSERGYVDLSRRNVTPEEAKACIEYYNKAKQVHGILKETAYDYIKYLELNSPNGHTCTLETLYEKIGWPLYESARFAHALDAFKVIAKNKYTTESSPLTELKQNHEIDEVLEEILLQKIMKRLAPKKMKIRADIEVSCAKREGIIAVKDALLYGINGGLDDDDDDEEEKKSSTSSSSNSNKKKKSSKKVNIELICSPSYTVSIARVDPDESLKLVNEAIERIRERILSHGGSYKLTTEARFMSEQDELEYQKGLLEDAITNDDEDDEEDDEDDEEEN